MDRPRNTREVTTEVTNETVRWILTKRTSAKRSVTTTVEKLHVRIMYYTFVNVDSQKAKEKSNLNRDYKTVNLTTGST